MNVETKDDDTLSKKRKHASAEDDGSEDEDR